MNWALWVVQIVLAALFLFGGVFKLVAPMDQAAAQLHLPVGFLRFIGLAEAAGAFGLVLPPLLHIQEQLTQMAAAGLLFIVVGAVVLTAQTGGISAALFPAFIGILLAFVCYGRMQSVRRTA